MILCEMRHMSKLTNMARKTFSFGQGLFFKVGTQFCGKRVTCLYSHVKSHYYFSSQITFLNFTDHIKFSIRRHSLDIWPSSGLEFQEKSSVSNIKTFCSDPIILVMYIFVILYPSHDYLDFGSSF